MGILTGFRTLLRNSSNSARVQTEIRDGIANLTDVLARRVDALSSNDGALAGQTRQELAEIRDGIANFTEVNSQRLKELTEGETNNAEYAARLQLEIRAGVENLSQSLDRALGKLTANTARQTQLIDQRLSELIATQEGQSRRTEQRLRDIAKGLGLPDDALSAVSVPSQAGTQRAEFVDIAEVQKLPMPQFSLRRPQPLTDLSVTREFREFVNFFATVPSLDRASLDAEDHAALYALARKLAPARAITIAADNAVSAETIARAMHDNGAGHLDIFDPENSARLQTILDAWPVALSRYVSAGTNKSAKLRDQISFAYFGAQGDADMANGLLDKALGQIIDGGIVVIGGGAPDQTLPLVDKALAAHPQWREIGAGWRGTLRLLALKPVDA